MMQALTPSDLALAVQQLPHWQLNELGYLVRIIPNPNYKQGLAWVQAIGEWSEAHDHHPDLLLTWPSLTVTFYTHTANGVTPKDIEAARAINTLIPTS